MPIRVVFRRKKGLICSIAFSPDYCLYTSLNSFEQHTLETNDNNGYYRYTLQTSKNAPVAQLDRVSARIRGHQKTELRLQSNSLEYPSSACSSLG